MILTLDYTLETPGEVYKPTIESGLIGLRGWLSMVHFTGSPGDCVVQ
jgi:hypothetical protein